MAKKTTTKKTTARKATKKPEAKPKTSVSKKSGTKTSSKTVAKPITTKTNDKKLSAIDAAATVLKGAKEPMNSKQMIEAMASKKLWSSPAGKTPHATLYSAILREITTKGKDSRFKKTERGKFVANK